jgi:hypothetical protein
VSTVVTLFLPTKGSFISIDGTPSAPTVSQHPIALMHTFLTGMTYFSPLAHSCWIFLILQESRFSIWVLLCVVVGGGCYSGVYSLRVYVLHTSQKSFIPFFVNTPIALISPHTERAV